MYQRSMTVLIAAAISLNTVAIAEDAQSPPDETHVRWMTTPAAAIPLQQASRRPLLIYVTADYCGYCRKMERDTWSDRDISQIVRDKFIALKLDAIQHAEIVSQLKVKALPTAIIFDGQGERVQTVSGYSRPEALLPLLEAVSSPAISPR